jgi:hypothetical protein
VKSAQDIEEILYLELVFTRHAYDHARHEVSRLTSDIASGTRHPDSIARIADAERANTIAMQAYIKALKHFNEFAVKGKVPAHIPIDE